MTELAEGARLEIVCRFTAGVRILSAIFHEPGELPRSKAADSKSAVYAHRGFESLALRQTINNLPDLSGLKSPPIWILVCL